MNFIFSFLFNYIYYIYSETSTFSLLQKIYEIEFGNVKHFMLDSWIRAL